MNKGSATMRKGFIFGAGAIGRNVYCKLCLIYDIIGYVDNNATLWGKTLNNIPITNPEEILLHDCDVIICSDYHKDIREQLLSMGIENIRMVDPLGYFLYEYHPKKHMQPVDVPGFYQPYKKEKDTMHILFVQQHPCIRTHKIAEMIVEKGIDVSIAYTAEPPEYGQPSYAKLYKGSYGFFSANDIVDFVEKSDFDLIHCSNEPDSLTNLMLLTEKPVVHDTHDWMSLNYAQGRDMLAMEYIAHKKSHGCIHVSEPSLELAKKIYHIAEEKAIVIETRPSEMAKPQKRLQKLSETDGELHCVYEGGIVAEKKHFRYMEDIWLQLAQAGVHVHFYTPYNPEYCKKVEQLHENIHYEGRINSTDLICEMTQYDCGLLLFHNVQEFKIHLDMTLANKLFEYLMAGLPVAVGDNELHKQFVEKYHVGAFLKMDGDIRQQVEKIKEIDIEDDFLEKNHLTMKVQADKLIAFYKKIIKGYRE